MIIRTFRTYAALVVSILLISTMLANFAYAEDAAALFKTKCAMCHGADAAGKTAMGAKFNIPDLRAPEIQKKSAADLGTVIAKGKNKMPAFDGKLSAAEITQLAAYVHQLKK